MTPAIERDPMADLTNAVAAYLSVMGVTADCLEQAFPDVGGPYRHRIHRLLTRVSFEATREAIKESARVLEAELKDYATISSRIRSERSVELERGILALGDIIENLAQRQDLFSTRLRHFAEQMEKATYPEDPQSFSEVMALQAAGLRGVVDRMNHESTAMVRQMRDRLSDLDHRLAGTASTDPTTGLINRRELERQIAAHRLHGATFSLLLFELYGPLGDQVLRAAGNKLASQFRHRDRTARWGEKEFAVLFLGDSELAQTRAQQVIPWVAGRYVLENGETVVIEAKARLLEPELAAA
jgi:GGDEF domain-containing protein